MWNQGTEERFYTVLASVLNVPRPSLTASTSRDSLEAWDSLKHMYMVLALEEEFNVEFTDDEIASLSSASELMDAIAKKKKVGIEK